jgi:hypothetical protein
MWCDNSGLSLCQDKLVSHLSSLLQVVGEELGGVLLPSSLLLRYVRSA